MTNTTAKNYQDIKSLKIRKKSYGLKVINQKISSLDIAAFFQQLATLLSAGIPIVQSCEILRQSQEKVPLQFLIKSLKQEIEAGKSLVNSLRKFPQYFDELLCQLIHTGEQTGTLEAMLKRIAHDKEKLIALKNQIKQALFYPCMIFLVAIIVSFTMLTFVVPRFAELFESMHGSLPWLTKVIIFVSKFLRENLWLGIFPFIAASLFIYYLKTSQAFKNRIDHFLLMIPLLGNIIKKIILARIARNLATTYAAGIPMVDALKMIALATGNYSYTGALISLQSDVSAGKQLNMGMLRNPLFPKMTVQMVKVGEETGTLDRMLDKIAELYEADIDHLITNLSHLLEPLIMIILGVLIGVLVVAMYLPIFKLGTII